MLSLVGVYCFIVHKLKAPDLSDKYEVYVTIACSKTSHIAVFLRETNHTVCGCQMVPGVIMTLVSLFHLHFSKLNNGTCYQEYRW